MRILWLKSDLLLPLDKGGKLRTWHLMRHLARQHEITYLSFADPDQPRADIDGMREVAARVETIPRSDPPKGSARFYADAAMHLVDPLPYAVGKYRSRAFARKFDELVASERFDLIVCDFLFPAVNLPQRLPCPSVMFTHNVESEIWRRHAETKSGLLSRAAYQLQYRRMLRYERRALARFDGILAVSDADRDTFARLYPGAIRQPVHVVPTGVDTSFFAPSPSRPDARGLVFTGSMDWLPNEDAMLYFCRDILPLVRTQEPEVTLSIVGRAPTPAVQRLGAGAGVTVTGRVDDVRPYMRDAAVYIVPLRIGGGTRLKIFEAMAMSKAVVSTTVGAEGLPVADNVDAVLADEPAAFAQRIVELLRDVPRRHSIETAARALVVERYDWSAVAGELDEALVRFARRRAQDEPRRESSPNEPVRTAQGRPADPFIARAERVEARATGRVS
jgi:sugar transferase (PEP-CTERM/EpsH1 system associated)